MTRRKFRELARKKAADLGEKATVPIEPREWASGSLGFKGSEEVFLEVAGEQLKFRATVELVALGSAKWPEK
jgi:hypothetical protein